MFRRPPNMASSEINDLIKRVIALPNETIELRGSDIYIDDQKLTEPYLADGTPTLNLGWVDRLRKPLVRTQQVPHPARPRIRDG